METNEIQPIEGQLIKRSSIEVERDKKEMVVG